MRGLNIRLPLAATEICMLKSAPITQPRDSAPRGPGVCLNPQFLVDPLKRKFSPLSNLRFSSFFPYNSISSVEYAKMSHPAPLSPRKSRAPPLKIKRRATPPDDAKILLLDRRIILALLCIRVVNALTICTFFQPDEYYQSLEPAWKLVYGYGETTWEWKEGIRGFMYPSLFAVVWWVARLIGLDDANTLVIG